MHSPRSVRKKQEEYSRCRSRDPPAARGTDQDEAAVVLQPMELHDGSGDPPAVPEGPHAGTGGCQKEAVIPCKREQAPSRTHGEGRLEKSVPERLQPWAEPTPDQLMNKCRLSEGPVLEKVTEECLPRD